MRQVHVRFGVSPRSRKELDFAINLAVRISGSLFVWTEVDRAARALLDGLDPDAQAREHAHVRDRVHLAVGRQETGLVPTFCQGDPHRAVHDPRAILVGPRSDRERSVAAIVATMGEASIGARGASEICLPFANGESALHAASAAIPLASALGAQLLLYHTTWREDGLPTEAPAERHMTAEAMETLDRIEEMCVAAGARRRVVIETATAIAEGTVRAALNERCALIVVARGRHVGRGSYVDQILERSVIPVLVAGRSKA